MKNRRKKRKHKNITKDKCTRRIIEELKDVKTTLKSTVVYKLIALIYDKYVLFIFPILSTLLFMVATFITFYGLLILKSMSNPIIWGSISYIVIYYLKSQFTSTINNFSYFNKYKSLINLIKLIILLSIAPIILAVIPNIFKGVDSIIFLIIPISYYVVVRVVTIAIPLNGTMNALSLNSYRGIRNTLLLFNICHILLLSYIYKGLIEHGEIYRIYNISAQALFYYIMISMLSNIIILVVVFIKRKNFKNWRTVKDGSVLFRYKHINGEVNQIYKEMFNGVFLPMRKYSNYGKLDDYTLHKDWKKTAKKLWLIPQPDSIEMMINNEFSSNLLFRIYNITKYWPRSIAKITRYSYSLLGILFCWRGVYLLNRMNNTLDSYILIFLGILLIWCSIFAFITYLSTEKNSIISVDFIFITMVIIKQLLDFALNFNVYTKVILFDFLLFIYMVINSINMQKKVKTNMKYDYFRTMK